MSFGNHPPIQIAGADQSRTPISSQIGGMMIKLPRGVQKGCGGGGGGEGGGVNTGAGMSADTKLFTGFPCVSTIRTLPCPKGTSYQV
ncbi:hypothetical protein A5706_07405 [Mycobacterium sp. E796]|nr:hypothetical protein A5706_07405 [Mycobacterium sp. E796]